MNERRLHIGALESSPGWEALNSQPLEGITHVCDARDLSRFADGTFSSLYASHVLEHFDYRDDVYSVLMEWQRVLVPGGHIYVSVPDLDTICRMYCDRERFNMDDRFMMMRMIMGGHCDRYDYHSVAFNEEVLAYFLAKGGFEKVRRVTEFGLFNDTSCHRFKGELISLNLIAEKPASAIQAANASVLASANPPRSGTVSMDHDLPDVDSGAGRFLAISTEKAINLFETGYTDQAIELCRELLSLFPENSDALLLMAKMYKMTGRTDEALILLNNMPRQSANYAESLFTRGMILYDNRDFTGGANCFTRLVELDDAHVEGYINLAMCLMELERPEEAKEYLVSALRITPEYPRTYLYLGNFFAHYWRLGEARENFQHVIELQADHAGAYNNLSRVAVLEGNIDEAITLLHTALQLQPNYRIAADNLLLDLNYSDSLTPEQIRNEHLRLADCYTVPVEKPAFRQRRPGGKIRVGYISGDFRTHSVAFFLEPVLQHHNRDHVEVFCYDMVTVADETTRRMMALGWTWRPVYGLSDKSAADMIRSDGIDILVDLAGHTLGNRLGVFALRPAPMQVTWLGYPNTTGLKQMDVRLTDNLADPTGMTEHLYSERLVRLPRSFLCYAPPASAPGVAPLPEGPVTFCSFNNNPKISDTVIRLWARILHALPGSSLMLKNGPLRDLHIQARLKQRFAELGIASSRLVLDGFTQQREEHLHRYGSCHIALDTYPYTGTTTTCEALWMGVPVVTLAGATHASRVGASILENSGLPELIAYNADQYVDIAVTLAQAPERLLKYRHSLREQLACSPLTDAGMFTADLEQAYRGMLERC